jgi:hypothetical protein
MIRIVRRQSSHHPETTLTGTETSPQWRRSSYCSSNACAEVTPIGSRVGLRNSTASDVILSVPLAAWREFVAALKVGDFDLHPR